MNALAVISGTVIVGLDAVVLFRLGRSKGQLTLSFMAVLVAVLSTMSVGAAMILMGLWNVAP